VAGWCSAGRLVVAVRVAAGRRRGVPGWRRRDASRAGWYSRVPHVAVASASTREAVGVSGTVFSQRRHQRPWFGAVVEERQHSRVDVSGVPKL
jgi:hypothetical protein